MELHAFNIFDVFLIIVFLFSVIVGMTRGFVREGFGLASWVGSGWCAMQDWPWVRSLWSQWIHDGSLLKIAVHGSVFLIFLSFTMLMTQWISISIRETLARSLDRSLGLLFGAVRGLVIILWGYTAILFFLPLNQQPFVVSSSKSVSTLQSGFLMIIPYIPDHIKSDLFRQNVQEIEKKKTDAKSLSNSLSSPPIE